MTARGYLHLLMSTAEDGKKLWVITELFAGDIHSVTELAKDGMYGVNVQRYGA